jgi:hypothetical protein
MVSAGFELANLESNVKHNNQYNTEGDKKTVIFIIVAMRI